MALMVLAALRGFPSGAPILLCRAGPAPLNQSHVNVTVSHCLGIRGLDADHIGVPTVSDTPRDRPESAAYAYPDIAGLTASMPINAMILPYILLIILRSAAILIAPE